MSGSPRSSTRWGGLGAGIAVMGACLVCCTAPVLSILGAVAGLSAVAAVWIPALSVLAVLAGAIGNLGLAPEAGCRRCEPFRAG